MRTLARARLRPAPPRRSRPALPPSGAQLAHPACPTPVPHLSGPPPAGPPLPTSPIRPPTYHVRAPDHRHVAYPPPPPSHRRTLSTTRTRPTPPSARPSASLHWTPSLAPIAPAAWPPRSSRANSRALPEWPSWSLKTLLPALTVGGEVLGGWGDARVEPRRPAGARAACRATRVVVMGGRGSRRGAGRCRGVPRISWITEHQPVASTITAASPASFGWPEPPLPVASTFRAHPLALGAPSRPPRRLASGAPARPLPVASTLATRQLRSHWNRPCLTPHTLVLGVWPAYPSCGPSSGPEKLTRAELHQRFGNPPPTRDSPSASKGKVQSTTPLSGDTRLATPASNEEVGGDREGLRARGSGRHSHRPPSPHSLTLSFRRRSQAR